MPFQKGRARTGGRKKGIQPIRAKVEQLCNEMGYDPFEAQIVLAKSPKTGAQLKQRIASDLAQYVRPRLKSVEHSGPGGSAIPLDLGVLSDSELEQLQRLRDKLASAGSDRGGDSETPGSD